MPTVGLSPLLPGQYFDNNGLPLAGGLLDTFATGTETPLASYTTSSGSVAHTNPVVLDASGRAEVWLAVGVGYTLRLRTAAGVTLWSVDDVLLAAAISGSVLPAGVTLVMDTIVVPTSNGAAVLTSAGFYPAEVYVVGVVVEVTQQFGNGGGLTGLSVGDSDVADRWGGGLTLTTGVKTKRGAGLVMYPTAQDLLVTGEGGLFAATGSLELTRLSWTYS